MLDLSNNSKTKFRSNHNNTFGLNYGQPDNGGTCPGATSGKGGCLDVRDGLKRQTCYMAKITQIYKAVGVSLQRNTDKLLNKTIPEMEKELEETVTAFTTKNPENLWYFRLHYSGDFFSSDYVKAWANVIKRFPKVQFWAYTRSYDLIEPLIGISNITLFLSCDPVNWSAAVTVYNKYKDRCKNLGLAYLGDSLPDKEVYRWVTCPETSGKVLNTKDQGACAKCRLCVDNFVHRVKNIHFKIH